MKRPGKGSPVAAAAKLLLPALRHAGNHRRIQAARRRLLLCHWRVARLLLPLPLLLLLLLGQRRC